MEVFSKAEWLTDVNVYSAVLELFARRIAEWLYRSLAKVPNAVPVFPN